MLACKVLYPSFIGSCYMDCAFAFNISHNLCYRILWRYFNQYMYMVSHQMPFQYFCLSLLC